MTFLRFLFEWTLFRRTWRSAWTIPVQSFSGVPGALRPSLKMVCEPQQLSLESVFKASSRYSEHIRNKQKRRKFHSEAVGSSEVLACTGPISRNPLVTRSVGILLSCWFFSELLSCPGTRRKICKTPKTLQAEIRMTWVTVLFATSAISPLWDPPIRSPSLKWPWHENENVSIKWAHGLLISENNIKVLDLIIWRSYSTPSNTGKSQFMIITTVEMIFWRFWKLERFPESKRPAHIFENLFQLHFERFRIVNWRIFGTGFSRFISIFDENQQLDLFFRYHRTVRPVFRHTYFLVSGSL